jgi:2-dehydro-3-deoxyphosphogluconate aldolase / (4S)-4-hydroxy-2-oxoglutarate aldolase
MNIQSLVDSKVVVVIRHANAANIVEPVKALLKGGIRAIEITVEQDGGLEAIAKLAELKLDLLLGAGTVLSEDMARQAIDAGAQFIVSPIIDQAIIEVSHKHHALAIPGVMTPTEIYQAIQHKADMIKIFPISNLGSSYINNIRAPLPRIPIMVTGGITLENAQEYLLANANVVGIGSQLLDLRKPMDESSYETITKNAKNLIEQLMK